MRMCRVTLGVPAETGTVVRHMLIDIATQNWKYCPVSGPHLTGNEAEAA